MKRLDGCSVQTSTLTFGMIAALLQALLAIHVFVGDAAYGQTSPALIVLTPERGDGEQYQETLTFVAELEDQTYIQVQLGISSVGPGDNYGACRALVVPKGGSAWQHAVKVDSDAWYVDDSGAPTLSMGRCSVVVGDEIEVTVPFEEGEVHLSIRGQLRPVEPPGSRIHIKKGRFYHYYVAIPFAPVEARWRIAGGAESKASGVAYSDKLKTNALPADAAKYWFRARILDYPEPFLALVRVPRDGEPEAWTWKHGDAKPVRATAVVTEVGRSEDKKEPLLRAELVPEGGTPIAFESQGQIFRFSAVEQMGLLKGRLVRTIIGNPVTRTFRASVAPSEDERVRTAIVEISHVK